MKPRTILVVVLMTASLATSPTLSNDYIVMMHEYPVYDAMDGYSPPPQKPVRLAFLHSPECPPSVAKTFYIMDGNAQVIQPGMKQSWCHPTSGYENGLRIGIACQRVCCQRVRCRCRHSRVEWYVWMEFSRDALYQPLVYKFSDPNDANRAGGPARFAPAAGATFAKFFDANNVEFKRRFKADEVRREFWRQYVAVGPKTFTDLRRWHFGLMGPRVSPEPTPAQTATVVDVRPGMRLRVEHAALQDQGPGGNAALRGHVATGTTYLQISEQPTRTSQQFNPFLSFDPFLGHLREVMAEPGIQGRSNVASGTLDLSTPSSSTRYFRLAYPSNWFSGTKIGENPQGHVVLIGSDDRADLLGLEVKRMVKADGFDWSTTNAKDPFQAEGFNRVLWTFRGRSFVVPEVRIKFDEEPTYVSVGTRFRQLVQRRDEWPVGTVQTRAQLYRRDAQGQHCVRFVVNRPEDAACFELPLLKGDEIKW